MKKCFLRLALHSARSPSYILAIFDAVSVQFGRRNSRQQSRPNESPSHAHPFRHTAHVYTHRFAPLPFSTTPIHRNVPSSPSQHRPGHTPSNAAATYNDPARSTVAPPKTSVHKSSRRSRMDSPIKYLHWSGPVPPFWPYPDYLFTVGNPSRRSR